MSAHVLIVEDDRVAARLVETALHGDEFETVVVETAIAALAAIEAERPDLLITDVGLPDLDGTQLCMRLRDDPRTADLPIIMLSAYAEVSDKVRGLEAGADEYLTKPIDPRELLVRVRALLARTRRLLQAVPHRAGKVIGFLGVKGGVGTTTALINTAMALAQEDASVIIVELRPYAGTLAFEVKHRLDGDRDRVFGLAPEEITSPRLEKQLVSIVGGPTVLFGPYKPGEVMETVTPETAGAVIRALRPLADYIVLDLPPQPSRATAAALGFCALTVLVLEPTPVCVAAASLALEFVEPCLSSRTRLGVVVVRRDTAPVSLLATDIAEELGCRLIGMVPQAAEALAEAHARGLPMAISQPEEPAAAAFRQIAQYLSSEEIKAQQL